MDRSIDNEPRDLSGFLYRPWVILFATALAVRLVFFFLMAGQLPLSKLPTLFPDSETYSQAASMIVEEGSFESSGVATFGPGYPTFLAAVRAVAGQSPLVVILLQILLGSLATVLLGKIAYEVTKNLSVAMVAGLLNALSLSSISLANSYLSDTLFFFLTAGALYLFVTGLRELQWLRILAAAPLLVAGVYTKSMLEHFWPVLLVMAVFYLWPQRVPNRTAVIRIGGVVIVTVAVMLAGNWLWSSRNERLYGVDTVSVAQPAGKMKLAAKGLSRLHGIPYNEAYDDLAAHIARRADTEESKSLFAVTAQVSDSILGWFIGKHPITLADALARNIKNGVASDYGVHYDQFPRWREDLLGFTDWVFKKGLNYRGALLTLIGAVMLLYRRRYRLALILAMFYGYFALATGFGQYQGNRLFYAGQFGWTILSAYPLVWIWERVRDRIKSRRARATDRD